jgi:hypothetical protein
LRDPATGPSRPPAAIQGPAPEKGRRELPGELADIGNIAEVTSLLAVSPHPRSRYHPAGLLVSLALPLVACGHTPIRVDGVKHESAEMRPLQSVPPDAYRQLRVLVRAGSADRQGTEGCGYAQLEGTLESDDLKNVACVPADAPNDAIRIVRQRLRGYGVQVTRGGTEPYDYTVDVHVAGLPPREPNRLAAKAEARLTFTRRANDAAGGFFSGLDSTAAGAAFAEAARDCALHDAELSSFIVTSTQPMNPEFDLTALAADAVDAAMGCDQLARFFRDAHTRFPKAPAAAPPPAP